MSVYVSLMCGDVCLAAECYEYCCVSPVSVYVVAKIIVSRREMGLTHDLTNTYGGEIFATVHDE